MRRILISSLLLAPAAYAGDLCAPTAKHHGTPISLDLQRASIRDAFRLIADTARVNLVVSDEVDGTVTLKLDRVAWDAATCTIAAVHHLAITVQDGILLVRRR